MRVVTIKEIVMKTIRVVVAADKDFINSELFTDVMIAMADSEFADKKIVLLQKPDISLGLNMVVQEFINTHDNVTREYIEYDPGPTEHWVEHEINTHIALSSNYGLFFTKQETPMMEDLRKALIQFEVPYTTIQLGEA